jgi:hypothetical protein
MEAIFTFLEMLTLAQLSVAFPLIVTFTVMLTIIVWEVICALDRATNTIIRFIRVTISWGLYKVAQLLILAFVAFAMALLMSQEFRYRSYIKLLNM